MSAALTTRTRTRKNGRRHCSSLRRQASARSTGWPGWSALGSASIDKFSCRWLIGRRSPAMSLEGLCCVKQPWSPRPVLKMPVKVRVHALGFSRAMYMQTHARSIHSRASPSTTKARGQVAGRVMIRRRRTNALLSLRSESMPDGRFFSRECIRWSTGSMFGWSRKTLARALQLQLQTSLPLDLLRVGLVVLVARAGTGMATHRSSQRCLCSSLMIGNAETPVMCFPNGVATCPIGAGRLGVDPS